jgi:hypothetical protein
MTCGCSFGFRFVHGIRFNLDCVFNGEICLDDQKTYCGVPKIKTNLFRRRWTSTTSIEFDAKPIKNVGGSTEVDPGPIVVNVNHTVPIRLLRAPIEFSACNATLDTKPCQSCIICENKKQVKFDCSNVAIRTALDTLYYAAAFNQCLGLDDDQ